MQDLGSVDQQTTSRQTCILKGDDWALPHALVIAAAGADQILLLRGRRERSERGSLYGRWLVLVLCRKRALLHEALPLLNRRGCRRRRGRAQRAVHLPAEGRGRALGHRQCRPLLLLHQGMALPYDTLRPP